MSSSDRPRVPVAGLVLVVLGVLFLGDQTGWFSFGWIMARWWPLILVAIGIGCIAERPSRPPFAGVMFLAFGAIFLLANFDLFRWRWVGSLWPLVLIACGIAIIFRGRTPVPEGSNEEVVHLTVLFGGNERVVKSQAFRGGSANVLFGGVDLDLREATPVPEGATFHVSAAFGGVELRVPPSWDVKLGGFPLFGGLRDERHRAAAPPGVPAPVLRVRGTVLFGGLSVKE